MRLSIGALALMLSMLSQPVDAAPSKGLVKRSHLTLQKNKGKIATVARRATRGALIVGGGALMAWGASKGLGAESLVAIGVGTNMATTGALTRSKGFAFRVAASIGLGALANGLIGGMAGYAIAEEGSRAVASGAALLAKGITATVNGTSAGIAVRAED